MRRCGCCGEEMRGTEMAGVWLPAEDEQVAEVWNPADPSEHARVCHVGCIPEGWETA